MPDNEVDSARFDVPKSPQRNIYQMTNFLGCDYTSSPSAVDANHSPDCLNMIRYMPGKIRKRMGYAYAAEDIDTIYGIWKWDNDRYFVHCGDKLYRIGRNTSGEFDWSVLSTGVDTSYSVRLKKKVLSPGHPPADATLTLPEKKLVYYRANQEAIIFGQNVMYFYNASKLENYVYEPDVYGLKIPTITIGKKPDGGGTSYDPFNLINPKFEESYYVSSSDVHEGEDLVFHTSLKALDSIDSISYIDSSGEWHTLTPGLSAGVTADKTNGTVTISSAITSSFVAPIEGEDNVKIVASKTITGYLNRIAKCSIAIAYGISGNNDRLFVSGNPDYPNYDWFSEKDDVTYFPDVNYSVLGSDATPIKGYTIVSNYLVTLKGEGTDKQSCIIRSGSFDTNGNPVFTVVKSLQGSNIIASDSIQTVGTEPLFLTKEGIMAITQSDISGGEIMNRRSFYLDGKLLKEQHLDNAQAIKNGDFYMLFLGSHVYILDTLQAVTNASAPYSTRQYAGFYWELKEAMQNPIVIDNVLYAATEDALAKFYTDENNLNSYNDANSAIYCRYDTADLDDLIFFKFKTYRYFAMRAFPATASSVKIYAYKNGAWELLKDDSSTMRYFTFSQLVFSKFTFRTDSGTRLVNTKARIKKMDHVKFRVENGEVNEPFMIDQIGIEFTQSGNYKN